MVDRIQDLEEHQLRIASKAIIADRFGRIERICGVDQAFLGDKVISGAVLISKDFRMLCKAYSIKQLNFPYIPGLLWFREGAAALEAISKLDLRPDLILVDGAGINHPRGAGLATHLGVELDLPSIGITKRILCGTPDFVPRIRYQHSVLRMGSKVVGYLVCTKPGQNPIVIAPGHRISLESSLKIALDLVRDHKLPEPLKLAHLYANQLKQALRSVGNC